MERPWYTSTVLYGLDIKVFQDSNEDGWGDFPGLLRRLDYLSSLGIGAVWLLPFYDSPFRDNGYDVVDHRRVDRRFGTEADFDLCVRELRDRGIHVVVDLIANHTSEEHPWFQAARRDPRSVYHDYYLWTDEPPPREEQPDPIIPETEDASTWSWDDAAGAWYFHRFQPFQPDLNSSNPQVLDEIEGILRHWVDRGVDGFRVDAVSHLIEREAHSEHHGEEQVVEAREGILERMRRLVSGSRPILLAGEADVDLERLALYFGEGDHLQALFQFLLAEQTFHALAVGKADALEDLIGRLPKPPDGSVWMTFLRNLDELDMERLSDRERDETYAAFAPEKGMRIYGRGIRRRLAPMLGGDPRRVRSALSLLFSLPGCPVVPYGDELGIGEDLSMPGRDAVRLPMPWDDTANGGFSNAPDERLVRRPPRDGPWAIGRLNVVDQSADSDSQLRWFQRLTAARRGAPEIGVSSPIVLPTRHPGLLALAYEGRRGSLVTLHDLTDEEVDVPLGRLGDRPATVVWGDERGSARIGERLAPPVTLRLAPHGYAWLRMDPER